MTTRTKLDRYVIFGLSFALVMALPAGVARFLRWPESTCSSGPNLTCCFDYSSVHFFVVLVSGNISDDLIQSHNIRSQFLCLFIQNRKILCLVT